MTASGSQPYRLIYASLLPTETGPGLHRTMRDILRVSHRLNWRDQITGLLLSDGEWFLQVLEGHESAVEACFSRIEQDSRHDWVTVRCRGPANERRFPSWSMCGVALTPFDEALMTPGDIRMDVFSAHPEALLQMMAAFAARHASWLDALHAELVAEVS
jgi:hypothetical protein